MKKTLLSLLILSISFLSLHSQAILLQQDFNTYNGLVSSIPAGFTISWNDTASISKSYYSSTAYCGASCNTYKFGVDSATIITPAFSNPGSVSFYLKGNGTYKPNKLKVYESPNGSVWNLVQSIDSIATTAQTVTLPLNSASTRVKFFYVKDSLGYNAGFDDLVVYGPSGVDQITGLQTISIYPSPSTGIVNVNFNDNFFNVVEIKVINILGKEVKNYNLKNVSAKYVMNLSDLSEGIYLLKVKSDGEEMVKRIVLKK